MKNINGFYLKIDFSDESILNFHQYDSHSCIKHIENNLIIFVQAGVRSEESAKTIVRNYKSNTKNHKPSRYTEGSFVIIDKENQKVIAGRDRSQAFHLYIYISKKNIYLSTDLSALIQNECKELDAVALDLYINQGIVLAPFPLVKGINALLPGHFITFSTDTPPLEQTFWKIEKVDIPKNYDDAVQKYGELFLESIQNNLSGDTNAVFLSGGSDSAAVMGAINKLKVKNVHATHMAIDGNFEFERDDVKQLKEAYGFNLHYIKPEFTSKYWKDYVRESLTLGTPNSIYISYPTYRLMGQKLRDLVSLGTTVFNGEMCILDQGFNESSDKTRNIRRWLYMKSGRSLSKGLKIWPEKYDVNWVKIRKPFIERSSAIDKYNVLRTTLQTFIHAIGRPADYYGGLKLGFSGMPGIWNGISLLPNDYDINIRKIAKEKFFDHFENDLKNNEWRQSIATLSALWYSESSNFTMPLDTAASGNLNMCFPFSSVDLMDFAASLPLEWTVDKKIQKDMCYRFLDMPYQVAYRMKNHKQKFSYFDTIYGSMKAEMIKTVLETDFGPLNEGIIKLNNGNKLDGNKLISLYGIALYINKYNLSVS
jgi:hypothetical protein